MHTSNVFLNSATGIYHVTQLKIYTSSKIVLKLITKNINCKTLLNFLLQMEPRIDFSEYKELDDDEEGSTSCVYF